MNLPPTRSPFPNLRSLIPTPRLPPEPPRQPSLDAHVLALTEAFKTSVQLLGEASARIVALESRVAALEARST